MYRLALFVTVVCQHLALTWKVCFVEKQPCQILFAVEKEFDIDIPDDAAQQIRTVRQMVDGIAELVARKSAGS